MDFSRQRFDEIVLKKLVELVESVGLRGRIEALWRGERINTTENRAVLHVALRQPPGAQIGGPEIEKTVMTERERMLAFAEDVRRGRIAGSSKKPFRRVVNIGIGGSDLGPAMGVLALEQFTEGAPNLRVRIQYQRLPSDRPAGLCRSRSDPCSSWPPRLSPPSRPRRMPEPPAPG